MEDTNRKRIFERYGNTLDPKRRQQVEILMYHCSGDVIGDYCLDNCLDEILVEEWPYYLDAKKLCIGCELKKEEP